MGSHYLETYELSTTSAVELTTDMLDVDISLRSVVSFSTEASSSFALAPIWPSSESWRIGPERTREFFF